MTVLTFSEKDSLNCKTTWIGEVTIVILISNSYSVLICKFYSLWESSIAFEIFFFLYILFCDYVCICPFLLNVYFHHLKLS